MSEGTTCYERDEILCEDPMCSRVGCRLRNDRLARSSTATDEVLAAAKRMQAFNALTQLVAIPWDSIDANERNHWIGLACVAVPSAAQGSQVPVREIKPHIYSPDYQAMGDCRVCGHGPEKLWHQPTQGGDKNEAK